MLRITFKKSNEMIFAVDSVFNNNYEDEWFDDALVREMIQDIDDSTVISSRIIDSPVLGAITPRELSGGVKALIMMWKTDWNIWATVCGDNCAKWILQIAEKKDITITLTHRMIFPRNDFEFYNVDKDEVENDFFMAWIYRDDPCLPSKHTTNLTSF